MTNLTWEKVGDVYYLESPSEELVKLHYKLVGKIIFWMNDEVYEIKRSGFWNQRYTLLKRNQEVLSVSHNFWGINGNIYFSDGAQYTFDFQSNQPLTLLFLDGESEILSYNVGKEEGKRKAIINLGIALVDAERLLLLATLGMVMFLNIFNEFNDGGDDADILLLVTAAS